MKRQFQIIATTFITVVLVSCSKEDISKPQEIKTEEVVVGKAAAKNVDPLLASLEGWYTFDNDLKDKTGKLGDASATDGNLLIYAKDRKGRGKSAVYFDGTYGIRIWNVPQQTHTSLSLWVKGVNADPTGTTVAEGSSWGPRIYQYNGIVGGGVTNSNNGSTTQVSWILANGTTWHHVVVTYDGSYSKVYIDNVLRSNTQFIGTIATSLKNYLIGMNYTGGRWLGYLDDVRFYSRTLTATDVQKLYES